MYLASYQGNWHREERQSEGRGRDEQERRQRRHARAIVSLVVLMWGVSLLSPALGRANQLCADWTTENDCNGIPNCGWHAQTGPCVDQCLSSLDTCPVTGCEVITNKEGIERTVCWQITNSMGMNGCDFIGAPTSIRSPTACLRWCGSMPGCLGFTFGGPTNTCTFKQCFGQLHTNVEFKMYQKGTGCFECNPTGFSKAFAPDTLDPDMISTLTFTIDNMGSDRDAARLDFTDNLPSGVVIADPANAMTTCMEGMLTADPGASVITYTGGTAPATGSCTVSVDVTSSTAGDHLNVTEEMTSSLGMSGTAADTLTINAPPEMGIPLRTFTIE